MKHRTRQNGLTLTELVVVVAILAVLLGISVPTAKKLMDSLEHSAGARSLINAALTSARAMAVSNNTPAGVRFQQDRNGDFYMIFILYDPDPAPNGTGLAQGFKAFPNRKPMKLPQDVAVLDGTLNIQNPNIANTQLDTDTELLDRQTFSIVFSEQGRMIQFQVRIRNRDGATDNSSRDPVFNTRTNVDSGIGMFYEDNQDVTAVDGLKQESSIHSFYIYHKKRMNETAANQRFTGYIQELQPEFINPYSGQLVKK
jgi:prepilin-type N-terminal cleavage/methylation domain-containing protein